MANAQELPKQFTTSQEMTFNLPAPEKIDQRHLVEMNEVYEECSIDNFSSGHKDCKCYAMTFLEERLKYPNVDKKVIDQTIRKRCYDTESMKGYYFGRCTNSIQHSIQIQQIDERKDPVELCNCFGRFIANEIPKMNRVTFKTLQKAQTRAYINCKFFN